MILTISNIKRLSSLSSTGMDGLVLSVSSSVADVFMQATMAKPFFIGTS